MAIYHCSVSMISRSSGRSSVGAVAYRSGEKLYNDYDGLTHDYSKKRGIEYSEIMLPENAPEEYLDRETLWNAVEKSEKRINSQTAREIEVALPNELDRKNQIEILREYIQENFTSRGMCADFSIHDKGDGNPHAHIMLTTREVCREGFTIKNRDWNNKIHIENWRKNWAQSCNRQFEKFNIEERIDHRSFKRQGLQIEPTIHLGAATKLEKKGIKTDRGNINRRIVQDNENLELINDKLEVEERERVKYVNPFEKDSPNLVRTLISFENEYIKMEKELSKKYKLKGIIKDEISNIENKVNELLKNLNKINSIDSKIGILENEKKGLKFYQGKEKKRINSDIENYKKVRENAINNIEKQFGIKFDQAESKVEELRIERYNLIKKIPLQSEIDMLEANKEQIALKYRMAKIELEISPERDKINKILTQFKPSQELEVLKAKRKLNTMGTPELKKMLKLVPADNKIADIIQNKLANISLNKVLHKGIER